MIEEEEDEDTEVIDEMLGPGPELMGLSMHVPVGVRGTREWGQVIDAQGTSDRCTGSGDRWSGLAPVRLVTSGEWRASGVWN